METKLTPYEQGFKAYGEGKGTGDNPFPEPAPNSDNEGRSDFWKWYTGWRQADREDGN